MQGSVSGRGELRDQPVTRFFADGARLCDHRDQNAAAAASLAPQLCATAAEQMQRRFADASSAAGGVWPSSVEHCYMSQTTALHGWGGPYWYWWPPKEGKNKGPQPHHRVCNKCKSALSDGSVPQRASNCTCDACR